MKTKKHRRKKSVSSPGPQGLGPKRARRAAELLDIALQHHAGGDLVRAEEAYKRVLDIDGANPRSLHHLGLIAHQKGQLDQAAALVTRAVEKDPRDAGAWNNLGNLLREQGRLAEAVAAYESALQRRADYPNALYNYALTLQKLGNAKAAVDAFRKVLAITPDDADAWNNLGAAQLDDGDPVTAMASHRRALELEPGSADAHNGLGLASMDAGQFEQAAEHYREAVRLDPSFAKAYLNLAKSHRFSSSDRGDLSLIESALGRPDFSSEEQIDLHFALGKALDDCARYDEAFAHFRSANSLKRATLRVDRIGFDRWIDNIISMFDAAFFAARTDYGSPSHIPVFIVGMPRSGTTLVEQIVSSHPNAFGAGELPKIGELVRDLSERGGAVTHFPHFASALQASTVLESADSYLEFLGRRSDTATRVTDKLPANYLYLGLIALLFPNAHVIDCRRDPRDIALSIFFSQFVGDHPFAYDLEDIAFQYTAYRKLMAHWDETLPLHIHRVHYETLVGHPEAESRKIIAACALPWDERCLRFYESERAVHTASNWQVRQPMYARSVARWKNYATHLSGLERHLGLGAVSDK